jgi:glycosyltransferase involved in cell wall biosynthesis
LESIARQFRLPDELVVCDDCSEDGTAAAVERFARRVDFQVSFFVNPHRLGVTQNFGRALSLCSGDVIVPCDQDDLWETDKLAVLEACFRNDPERQLAFSDLTVISPDGKPADWTQWQRLQFGRSLQVDVNAGRAFELLLRFNVITGAAMAFRSSLRERVLPIPDGYLHDEWIGLVAAATGRLLCIDRPLVRYRQHAGQTIGPAAAGMLAQYRHARANMTRPYFVRMVERTRRLHERLSAHRDALLCPDSLAMVEQKLLHAQTRLRMRDEVLVRWPLAIGEAVRGRYSRYGYGLRSFLQDLVL